MIDKTRFSFYTPSDYYFLDCYSSTSNSSEFLEEYHLVKILDNSLLISNGREVLRIKGKHNLALVRKGRICFFPLATSCTKKIRKKIPLLSLLKSNTLSLRGECRRSYRNKNLILNFVLTKVPNRSGFLKSLRKRQSKARLLSLSKRGEYVKFNYSNNKLPSFLPVYSLPQSNKGCKLYTLVLFRNISNLLFGCRRVGLIYSVHLLRYIYRAVKHRLVIRYFVNTYGVKLSKRTLFFKFTLIHSFNKYFENLIFYCFFLSFGYKKAGIHKKNLIKSGFLSWKRTNRKKLKNNKERIPYYVQEPSLVRSRFFLPPVPPQKKFFRSLAIFKNVCISYSTLDRNNKKLNFFEIFNTFRKSNIASKKERGGRVRYYRYSVIKKLSKIYHTRFNVIEDTHLKLLQAAYPRNPLLYKKRMKSNVVIKLKKKKKGFLVRRKKKLYRRNHATIR
jgi:hypothetical protein